MHVFPCEVGRWELRNFPEELWMAGQTVFGKGWPVLLSEQKDRGLQQHQSSFGKIIRYDISAEELDLHSPFCPLNIVLEGKVLPPQLCPKIRTKKGKFV